MQVMDCQCPLGDTLRYYIFVVLPKPLGHPTLRVPRIFEDKFGASHLYNVKAYLLSPFSDLCCRDSISPIFGDIQLSTSTILLLR